MGIRDRIIEALGGVTWASYDEHATRWHKEWHDTRTAALNKCAEADKAQRDLQYARHAHSVERQAWRDEVRQLGVANGALAMTLQKIANKLAAAGYLVHNEGVSCEEIVDAVEAALDDTDATLTPWQLAEHVIDALVDDSGEFDAGVAVDRYKARGGDMAAWSFDLLIGLGYDHVRDTSCTWRVRR